jgi:hypothetical protein
MADFLFGALALSSLTNTTAIEYLIILLLPPCSRCVFERGAGQSEKEFLFKKLTPRDSNVERVSNVFIFVDERSNFQISHTVFQFPV